MLTIHMHCWRVVQKEHATTNHHREYSDAYFEPCNVGVFSLKKKVHLLDFVETPTIRPRGFGSSLIRLHGSKLMDVGVDADVTTLAFTTWHP